MKNKNKKYLLRAQKIIPGVSQLLGKRPEMYLKDGNWPTYYKKAKEYLPKQSKMKKLLFLFGENSGHGFSVMPCL